MPSATPLPPGPSHLALFGAGDLLRPDGCPVCRYVADAGDRFLGWFALEAHADADMITRLCRSLGFCAPHARGMLSQPGAEGRMTAVYTYLLRAAARYLAEGTSPSAPCLGCTRDAEATERALDTLLTGLQEPDIRDRYRAAHGLCLPHLRAAAPRRGPARRPPAGRLAGPGHARPPVPRPARPRDAHRGPSAAPVCAERPVLSLPNGLPPGTRRPQQPWRPVRRSGARRAIRRPVPRASARRVHGPWRSAVAGRGGRARPGVAGRNGLAAGPVRETARPSPPTHGRLPGVPLGRHTRRPGSPGPARHPGPAAADVPAPRDRAARPRLARRRPVHPADRRQDAGAAG